VPEPLGPLCARSLPILALVMAYSRALRRAHIRDNRITENLLDPHQMRLELVPPGKSLHEQHE